MTACLRWLGAALGFLKVEAADLNKCPSIMNVARKLRNFAGSCRVNLRRLLQAWVDGSLLMEVFF